MTRRYPDTLPERIRLRLELADVIEAMDKAARRAKNASTKAWKLRQQAQEMRRRLDAMYAEHQVEQVAS